MKIAVIQSAVIDDKAANLKNASEKIAQAAGQGADVVILPEMFCCPYSSSYFTRYAEEKGQGIWTALSDSARENKVLLIGGSMPESCGGKIYNSSFVFNAQGEQIACHRKVHLFDIDVENGQRFKESDTFSAGDRATVFDTPFGKLGVMICFDIRFPELSRMMTLEGAQVIFVPAAFNMTTGPAHWETSFRQRAIDNQLYMVGCAPARDENGPYVSYGNSIVTSPWGTVLERAGEGETILYAELDLLENARIRRQLPLLSALRTDVYRMAE